MTARASEVAAGVHRITTPLPYRPRSVHAYLLRARSGFALVDGGTDSDDAWAALEAGVAAVAGGWDAVHAQIVTHMHVDHQGLVGRVVRNTGCPVIMGRLDAERARHARRHPGEEAAFRRRLLVECGAPSELVEALGRPRPSPGGFPDEAVREVEGDAAEASDALDGWRVVSTPGHTAGHISLFRASDAVLIAGDAVLPRVTPTIGVNRQRTDPVADYLDTLDRLLEMGVRRSLGGHGEPIDPAAPRIRALRTSTATESERVGGLLDHTGAATAWELARRRYGGRDLPDSMRFQAVREIRAHLEHLVGTARARADAEPGGVLVFSMA